MAAIRAFADNAVIFLSRGQAGQATENLAHISAASARMGTIIGQIKGFARKSHEALATVDLSQSIEASARLVRNDFQRNAVQLEIEIRDAVEVVGDAMRTEQVLINLMRNALDAVDDVAEKKVQVRVDLHKRHKSPTELVKRRFFRIAWHHYTCQASIVEYSTF